MAEIRWDYEQISSFVDQLEACIDVLKDQQTFLKRFQADAAGGWPAKQASCMANGWMLT